MNVWRGYTLLTLDKLMLMGEKSAVSVADSAF
nr:MAG TPA: hypothetical protein [Caudoviricetes sp.]